MHFTAGALRAARIRRGDALLLSLDVQIVVA
jgi:hypothetical protein